MPSRTSLASVHVNSSSDYYYLRNTLKDLLLARSVKRGDFVLASGRRSSFYVDARLTTMSGDGLAVVGGLGLDRMAVRGWSPRAVGGLTLGADPIAYALVLTTGRSARDAISAVESEGGHVLGVMAVMDREEGGREAIERECYLVEAFLTASDLGLGFGQ